MIQNLSNNKITTQSLILYKGWKFPFLACPCNPNEETPETIISKICLHPNCKDKLIYCNECIGNNLHDKLHSTHIFKLKEFFEKCLNISLSYQNEEKIYKHEQQQETIQSNFNDQNKIQSVFSSQDMILNIVNNTQVNDWIDCKANELYKEDQSRVKIDNTHVGITDYNIQFIMKNYDLPQEMIQLFNTKDFSLMSYKMMIDSEIKKIDSLFQNILDEIFSLFNERKMKLINHLKKTFETYSNSHELYNSKVSEYINNSELLKQNSLNLSQENLITQLMNAKSLTSLKEIINKANFKINQIQSVNKDNLENLTKFAHTLKSFQQIKPEIKSIDVPIINIDNQKYEYLEALDIKSALILAQRKLNFSNIDDFQKLCTEIINYTDTFNGNISQNIQNTLAEYECFIQENKKSEDFAVTISNYYVPSFNKPFIHYFHPNTKDLFLYNLSLNDPMHNSPDYIFQKMILDIPFNIPANHTSLTTPDGRLFLNGGKGSLDKMYEMNFEERKLMQKCSMKQKRWDHATCFSKGYIFVFGGADKDENYKLTKKCDKYDIILDNWIEIANFSNEASDFSVCNFHDRYIYKFGGWNSISYVNIIERYDIEFDQWIIINPPLKPLLGGFPECIQVNERQIYVFGGFFVKGHDENFILEIDEGERGDDNYFIGLETVKLANKISFPVRSQFKMAKSVLVHNNLIFCIHKNKEQTSLLSFDGKIWKILNENLFKNFEILE